MSASRLAEAIFFSQIRNNRYARLEESLNKGFDVNECDEDHGNTALLVAAQNLNKKMAALLLSRGANIDHQNNHGNTAMHYAMAYESAGLFGEFLVEHGMVDIIAERRAMRSTIGRALSHFLD